MKTINYPYKVRSHLVTIVPMASFTQKSTSKLRSALHSRYLIVTLRFIPRANTAQSYYGFCNTFDYNHSIYSDYSLCTVTASAHRR